MNNDPMSRQVADALGIRGVFHKVEDGQQDVVGFTDRARVTFGYTWDERSGGAYITWSAYSSQDVEHTYPEATDGILMETFDQVIDDLEAQIRAQVIDPATTQGENKMTSSIAIPARQLNGEAIGDEIQFPWTFRGHKTRTIGKLRTVEHRTKWVVVTLQDEDMGRAHNDFHDFFVDPEALVIVPLPEDVVGYPEAPDGIRAQVIDKE